MTTKPTIQRMISDAWHNFRNVEERSGGQGRLFQSKTTGHDFALLAHISTDAKSDIFDTEPETTARHFAEFLIGNGAPAAFLDALAGRINARCRECDGMGYIPDARFPQSLDRARHCRACDGSGEVVVELTQLA